MSAWSGSEPRKTEPASRNDRKLKTSDWTGTRWTVPSGTEIFWTRTSIFEAPFLTVSDLVRWQAITLARPIHNQEATTEHWAKDNGDIWANNKSKLLPSNRLQPSSRGTSTHEATTFSTDWGTTLDMLTQWTLRSGQTKMLVGIPLLLSAAPQPAERVLQILLLTSFAEMCIFSWRREVILSKISRWEQATHSQRKWWGHLSPRGSRCRSSLIMTGPPTSRST